MLEDAYIESCVQRARQYQGAWTGTTGSIAADSMRLVMERRELLKTIDKLKAENAALRAAVEGRQGFHDDETPSLVSGMNDGELEAAWMACKQQSERVQRRRAYTASRLTLIGTAGLAGSGKNTVCDMIPGAAVVGFADPLYRMLSAMLGMPEADLRSRTQKDGVVPVLGRTVRELLQTLGTEWGRNMVCEDVWVRLAGERVKQLEEEGATAIALCDVRFENEAEWIRARGGEVWHVIRPGVARQEHCSESGIRVHPRDTVIENSGDEAALRAIVERLCETGGQAYNG
jgi:hypothetical protein